MTTASTSNCFNSHPLPVPVHSWKWGFKLDKGCVFIDEVEMDRLSYSSTETYHEAAFPTVGN